MAELIQKELTGAIIGAATDEARLLTCLKLSQKRIGLLINFNVRKPRGGIRRLVH